MYDPRVVNARCIHAKRHIKALPMCSRKERQLVRNVATKEAASTARTLPRMPSSVLLLVSELYADKVRNEFHVFIVDAVVLQGGRIVAASFSLLHWRVMCVAAVAQYVVFMRFASLLANSGLSLKDWWWW